MGVDGLGVNRRAPVQKIWGFLVDSLEPTMGKRLYGSTRALVRSAE